MLNRSSTFSLCFPVCEYFIHFLKLNNYYLPADSTRIWDSPTTGDIRLTGGSYSNEGLLEVYCSGEWGTVCDDTFFDTEAIVSCSQLGYNNYNDYDHLPMYVYYTWSTLLVMTHTQN